MIDSMFQVGTDQGLDDLVRINQALDQLTERVVGWMRVHDASVRDYTDVEMAQLTAATRTGLAGEFVGVSPSRLEEMAASITQSTHSLLPEHPVHC